MKKEVMPDSRLKIPTSKEDVNQLITPCLWFNNKADEAAEIYSTLFPNSTIGTVSHYGREGYEIHRQPEGLILTIEFELMGFQFLGLNGGPQFTFTPALSFFVLFKTETELESLWGPLAEGGDVLMPLDSYEWSEKYGWLKDKFGVSWQLMVSNEPTTQQIVPSLMFTGKQAGKAEKAMQFYSEIFPDSAIGQIARYGSGQPPNKEGTVMYADFRLKGQRFAAMDNAQEHDSTFNEAVSLIINCKAQDEIDYYWERLSAVPEAEQCGWLKDKFGVSWQVVPTFMSEIFAGTPTRQSERIMKAVLGMQKIDIETIKKAFGQ